MIKNSFYTQGIIGIDFGAAQRVAGSVGWRVRIASLDGTKVFDKARADKRDRRMLVDIVNKKIVNVELF